MNLFSLSLYYYRVIMGGARGAAMRAAVGLPVNSNLNKRTFFFQFRILNVLFYSFKAHVLLKYHAVE